MVLVLLNLLSVLLSEFLPSYVSSRTKVRGYYFGSPQVSNLLPSYVSSKVRGYFAKAEGSESEPHTAMHLLVNGEAAESQDKNDNLDVVDSDSVDTA